MAEDNAEVMQQLTARFIELANSMANDGDNPTDMVSGALMSASAFYATFAAAGNEGGLTPSGVDKVVDLYRDTLQRVQDYKKDQVS